MTLIEQPEDLTHTCWRHDLWLASYPLTRNTVLDYFALSPFYDRNCLNERAKEQGVEPSRILYDVEMTSGWPRQHTPAHSTLAPGMEFALQDFQEPHLYIIVKQKRCLYHIKAAFSMMREDLDPLTAGQRLLDTPAEKAHRLLEAAAASQQPAPRAANGTDAPTATATLLPTREQAAKVDRVLASTLAQFPFPSVVQRVQQLTLEAASGAEETAAAAAQEVIAQPEVEVEVKPEVKIEEKKEDAPPPIKRLKLKRSLSKPAV